LLLVAGAKQGAQRLAPYLTSHGVRVTAVRDDATARHEAASGNYDCVLLDLGDRAVHAVALTHALRAHTAVPIVFLVETKDIDGRVAVLEAGADACVAVPYSERELLLRIQVAVRRARTSHQTP
jgi:DNA-binding response OmpR family regulator